MFRICDGENVCIDVLLYLQIGRINDGGACFVERGGRALVGGRMFLDSILEVVVKWFGALVSPGRSSVICAFCCEEMSVYNFFVGMCSNL